ncbi:hypothetical protein ACH4E5_02310, partial [Streptomyces afghaniensis]|uniref:hypothetical protein n=1 Tax=Streptomyces afghaniensis TaxID=66865 RepID=UPI00379CB164
ALATGVLPDGRTVAVIGDDHGVSVRDLATGQAVDESLLPTSAVVGLDIAYLGDGSLVVVIACEKGVVLAVPPLDEGDEATTPAHHHSGDDSRPPTKPY